MVFVRSAVMAVVAAGVAEAFVGPALLSTHAPSSRRASAVSNLQMGWFDNVMGNKKEEEFLPEALPDQQIITGLSPIKGQVLITFLPSGAQVNARPGEKFGDAARRAGLNVPYGCKQGVCGTCEAVQKQPNGQAVQIKVCSATVPKTNLDAPDREKMWGDLRGGKKSVNELRGTPEEITITMQNPNIAMKKKATFDNNKDIIKQKANDWLSPDYKAPVSPRGGGGGQPPPPPPEKKGWF